MDFLEPVCDFRFNVVIDGVQIVGLRVIDRPVHAQHVHVQLVAHDLLPRNADERAGKIDPVRAVFEQLFNVLVGLEAEVQAVRPSGTHGLTREERRILK